MQSVGEFRRLDVARLLREVRNGNNGAIDHVLSVAYGELRRIVRGVVSTEGECQPLQPGAIVREAFYSLLQSPVALTSNGALDDLHNRAHFLALSAHQLRVVLSDHVRRRSSRKAGAGLSISLGNAFAAGVETIHNFVDVDQLLNSLAKSDPAMARILEMFCFGGMNDQEVALVEHATLTKVKKDREAACALFAERLATHKLGKQNC